METELVRKAGKGTAALYTVKKDGVIIGLLEKYNNTRTEQHPWKAFKGHGGGCCVKFLGAFYPAEGGKTAALAAIAAA